MKLNCEVTSKLRNRKDHYLITIYKEYRKKIDISVGDIILFKINNIELIRKVKKDFHISIPKRFIDFYLDKPYVEIEIINIFKVAECTKRPSEKIIKNRIDIRSLIPLRTIFGHSIYVVDRMNGFSSVWYAVGGGVEYMTIANFVDVREISEFLGFLFGDGSKSKGLRSIRLTNCEYSILNHCLHVFEKIGISRSLWKGQVIYSTDERITQEIDKSCKSYWSQVLNIEKEKVVSVLRAKSKKESLKYGSIRIFIDSAILSEIFLQGLLPFVLERIQKPENSTDYKMSEAFLRGLLAAEGGPQFDRGRLSKVGVSYNPHGDELELYRRILTNLNIDTHVTKNNELFIYGWENFFKLYKMNCFSLHKPKNIRFITGFRKMSKSIELSN